MALPVAVLDELLTTPLDEISQADADVIVAELLRRDEDDSVDVARFGSSI